MTLCFNPKREARPSQTKRLFDRSQRDSEVSIPNGKPGPLRRGYVKEILSLSERFQSQTGSQALSDPPVRTVTVRAKQFQSQTGSQALSDRIQVRIHEEANHGFNPKREARPSQTRESRKPPPAREKFQSQTGSQALSDPVQMMYTQARSNVSIPNGKPGPLRHDMDIATPPN